MLKKYILLNMELQKSMLYYFLRTSQGEAMQKVLASGTFLSTQITTTVPATK